MKEEKISFFRRFLISIKDFEKYRIFAEEKLKKSIIYIIIITLIFTLIIAFFFSIKYGILINNFMNYIKTDLPDFTYENGKLSFNIENPLEIENGDSSKNDSYKVIIDTQEVTDEKVKEYKDKINLYNYGMLILNNRVIVNISAANRNIEQSYSDIQYNYGVAEKFNRQELVDFLNNNKIGILYVEIFVIMFLYLFITYLVTSLFDAILLAILGYLTALIVRVKTKFKNIYAMALHALTLSITLNAIYMVVNIFTGFYIKYFNLMYTAISYIYIIAAILSIRQELIKQQVEIGQINNKEEEKEIEEKKEKQEEPKEEQTENEESKEEKENKKPENEEPQNEGEIVEDN